MEKIPTIFERDGKYVVPKLIVNPTTGYTTEKLDGTNVRLTIRNDAGHGHGASYAEAVRLEKRRNPTKEMKAAGITAPWYVDASRDDPADRWIWEAVDWVPLLDMPEGEWSGEAVGPKIQGNPLGLPDHRIYFFDRAVLPREVCVPRLHDAPLVIWSDGAETAYASLRDYLAGARSLVNPAVPMEGIVWSHSGGYIGKVKRKDFPAAVPAEPAA